MGRTLLFTTYRVVAVVVVVFVVVVAGVVVATTKDVIRLSINR